MNNYLVYIHTNLINGKKYVGITQQSPKRRWQNGAGYYGTHFYNAIKKYGWDSFSHVIIVDSLTQDQAYKMEQEMIIKYQTTDNSKGYNKTISGGVGVPGLKHSEKTKQLLSQIKIQSWKDEEYRKKHSGVNNGNYGKHLTAEARQKLSDLWKGRTFTEETRKKISEANKGKIKNIKSPLAKKVIQYSLKGEFIKEFENIHIASRETGADYRSISTVCNGRRKTTSGYIWKFKEK